MTDEEISPQIFAKMLVDAWRGQKAEDGSAPEFDRDWLVDYRKRVADHYYRPAPSDDLAEVMIETLFLALERLNATLDSDGRALLSLIAETGISVGWICKGNEDRDQNVTDDMKRKLLAEYLRDLAQKGVVARGVPLWHDRAKSTARQLFKSEVKIRSVSGLANKVRDAMTKDGKGCPVQVEQVRRYLRENGLNEPWGHLIAGDVKPERLESH